MNYVSLHNHSNFSMLEAMPTPRELFQRAKELGQPALAVTDHGTFSAVWDAAKAAKEAGVKFIVGCEFYFVNDSKRSEGKIRHVILLAKNAIGYRNLLLMNRAGFDHSVSTFGKRVYPIIDWNLLQTYSDGVICLTACGGGIVGQLLNNKKFNEAEETIQKLIGIFGDNFGIEIQPNNLRKFASNYNDSIDQDFTNAHLIRLAKKFGVRIVPTSNAHYLSKDDADTHDAMLAIGSGQPQYSNARLKYDVPDFFLHSADEMLAFFNRKYEGEVDGWLENTIHFANLCESPDWIDPKYSNPSGKELPVFPVQDQVDYEEFHAWVQHPKNDAIRTLAQDKLYMRFLCEKDSYNRMPKDHRRVEYEARLAEEIEVIEFHGFSSYMLIVADFIEWARKNDILTGPGRGSVGGSLIGYILDIHRADPIQYKLIFARFHNKEKSSFPDIDSDFAPYGRNRVLEYVRGKYGDDKVAHVSNLNTITPKVYAKDITRACELAGSRTTSVKLGEDIANSIPSPKDVKTFEKAIEKSGLFAAYVTKYPKLKKYAAICGNYRAWATHAAGIVISQRPLAGLVPLRRDKEGTIAVEYDKDRAEENGLVKMDFLGLETLDIIKETFDLANKAGKPFPPTQQEVKLDDPDTYDLLSRGDTFCVFQLGTSSGTIDLCKKIRPQSIEDISAINSLARPSARDIREDYVKTKDGRLPFKLLDPSLQRAFGGTFGYGLYEECLMYLAQDVAGWTLHEADRLRKLTKEKGKNPKKAAKWRQDFIDDALKNKNIDPKISTQIWDEVVDKFQGYGFNLSHSILYSMTSYYTAYLKAHYPLEFLLANLKSEIRSKSKPAKNNIEKIKTEIRRQKVIIYPPDINKSDVSYTIKDAKTVITGLDAMKFCSRDAIQEIVDKRPFRNFFDFMVRCDKKKLNSKTIKVLAATGCLDSFGMKRRQIYLYVEDYRKKLDSWLKKNNPLTGEMVYPWPDEPEWSLSERYALEKLWAGEGFSCGKKDAFAPFFDDKSSLRAKVIRNMNDKERVPSLKAEIKNIFVFKVKKEGSKLLGREMAKLTIEDVYGDQISLTLFPDSFDLVQERLKLFSGGKQKLEEGICLHFNGQTNLWEDDISVAMENIFSYAPPPKLPADFKEKKKVNLRQPKTPKEEKEEVKLADQDDIAGDIERELFDEGLIEFDEDPHDS